MLIDKDKSGCCPEVGPVGVDMSVWVIGRRCLIQIESQQPTTRDSQCMDGDTGGDDAMSSSSRVNENDDDDDDDDDDDGNSDVEMVCSGFICT